jgi:iron only hydrogenase large subunit-like protein
MLGAIVKSYWAEKNNVDPSKIYVVSVMPCTAKKYEKSRDELKVNGIPDVDAVITTQELILMIKESGLLFDELEPEAVDMPFGIVSGAGVIFGVTGGVTEAVLRRVSESKSHTALLEAANAGQRGLEGVKEFYLNYGERQLHIAVVRADPKDLRVERRLRNVRDFADPVAVIARQLDVAVLDAHHLELVAIDRARQISRSRPRRSVVLRHEQAIASQIHSAGGVA